MSISSTTAVNSHISKGKKARRDYYPLVNRGYGSRFSLKMAIQDKHCLVSTTCTMRTELEKKKCANILYTEGEVFNPTLKYQSLRRQGSWKYKAFQADDVYFIRSVAFLLAFPMLIACVLMVVTCDKQRTEWVIAVFLLSSVSLQIRNQDSSFTVQVLVSVEGG